MAWKPVGDVEFRGNLSGTLSSNRNKIINGNFSVWQRGTSFNTTNDYTADRWKVLGLSGQQYTVSRQLSGLERFQYCARIQRNSGVTNTGLIAFGYAWESSDVIQMQGRPYTISFYARAGANYSQSGSGLTWYQMAGTGTDQGSFVNHTNEINVGQVTFTISTSWQRYSFTGLIPRDRTSLRTEFDFLPTGTAGANDWVELTGIQLELDSAATEFEFEPYETTLRKCQRYYWKPTSVGLYSNYGIGNAASSTLAYIQVRTPTMRAAPSAVTFSNLALGQPGITIFAITAIAIEPQNSSSDITVLGSNVASGLTTGAIYSMQNFNNASGFLALSAEI